MANPIGMIASGAMMLRHSFDLGKEADLIEGAIQKMLAQGYRTKDIEAPGTKLVGTKEMGALVLQNLEPGQNLGPGQNMGQG